VDVLASQAYKFFMNKKKNLQLVAIGEKIRKLRKENNYSEIC